MRFDRPLTQADIDALVAGGSFDHDFLCGPVVVADFGDLCAFIHHEGGEPQPAVDADYNRACPCGARVTDYYGFCHQPPEKMVHGMIRCSCGKEYTTETFDSLPLWQPKDHEP